MKQLRFSKEVSRSSDPSGRRYAADPFEIVNTVIDRKYAVDRAVAEGGYGVVYRGHHTALGISVAIKLLKLDSHGTDPTATERVAGAIQEAHSLAQLRHPGIVSVFDAGETFVPAVGRSVPYIVFEWLAGLTLADDLTARRRGQTRTISEAMLLWRPVCEAIAFAHEARIVHRDLKPTNIIIQGSLERPAPKVIDFGIAKLLGPSTRPPESTRTESRRLTFSPDYAAPEQLAGTRTGPWTDVHALGLLLVEILVDQPPYGTGDPEERYTRAFSTMRPTPKRFGVDVGPLDAVLARTLALKPRDRYASATELLAAVDGVLAALRENSELGSKRIPVLEKRGQAGAEEPWAEENSPFAGRDLNRSGVNTASGTTVATGRSMGSGAAARSRLRRTALPLMGATALVGLTVGWQLLAPRAPETRSATPYPGNTPRPHTASDAGVSSAIRTTPSAEVPTPVASDPAATNGTHASGQNSQTANARPLSRTRPTNPAAAHARPASSSEPRPTRGELVAADSTTRAEPTAPAEPSAPPMVTTPGVPAPYRLE